MWGWDQIFKLLAEVRGMIDVLAWPVVAVVALVMSSKSSLWIEIGKWIATVTSLRLKAGGFDVEAQRTLQQQQATSPASDKPIDIEKEGTSQPKQPADVSPANSQDSSKPVDSQQPHTSTANDAKPTEVDRSDVVGWVQPMLTKIDQELAVEPAVLKIGLVEALKRTVAQERLTSVFERAYGSIFGSQLDLLVVLRSRGDNPLPTQDVASFYNRAAADYPKEYADDTFARWLQYLQHWDLIKEVDGGFLIDEPGKVFLSFVAARGYPWRKRL